MEIHTANVDKEPVIIQILRIKLYFFYLRFIEWHAFRRFQAFSEFCGFGYPKGRNRLRFHDNYNKYYAEKPGVGPDFAGTNGRNLLNRTEFHTLPA